MNGRTLIMLGVAILIAIATVIVVKNRTQSSGGTKVLVASVDIDAGSFIRADKQLVWSDWPRDGIAPSFVTSDTHKLDEFSGGIARRAIQAGEPITDQSIVRANEGGFMSAVLKPGMRAVSIAVTLTSGNAGFIFPGDRVDLILTHHIPSGNTDVLASETFIQDVRVLASDQMLANPDNKAMIAKTITLEVSPKQAEMINVATNLGAISVSLRSLASGEKAAKGGALPVTGVGTPAAAGTGAPQIAPDPENYSTNNDVSKLMGDKNEVRAKVSVYHGGTTEQLDFHQGQGSR